MSAEFTFFPSSLRITEPAVFGPGFEERAQDFTRRAFALPEVSSIRIETGQGRATISFRAAPEGRSAFLGRLAEAIGSEGEVLDESLLPSWTAGREVVLQRAGGCVSTLQIVECSPGLLRIALSELQGDGAREARLVAALVSLNGVRSAKAVPESHTLRLEFDPAELHTLAVIRAVEALLAVTRSTHRIPESEPVPFGVANTAVGLGTVEN